MDKPPITSDAQATPKLLIEAIDIITKQLLLDSKFCGSDDGRRLHEVRFALVGRSRGTGSPRIESERIAHHEGPTEVVSRTVALPMILDQTIGTTAEQCGMSRDAFIIEAIGRLVTDARRR